MDTLSQSSFGILFLLFLVLCDTVTVKENPKSIYIVHVAKSEMPESFDHHTAWYGSSLKSVSVSAEMLYTYDNAIHGFSTRLTEEEARLLESQGGILVVLPEKEYELHTTRMPMFLGLDKSADLFPESSSKSDVIVGVLDTGVWLESKSFDDTGLRPVPTTWKGECKTGINFTTSNCNRIIRKRIHVRVEYVMSSRCTEEFRLRKIRNDELRAKAKTNFPTHSSPNESSTMHHLQPINTTTLLHEPLPPSPLPQPPPATQSHHTQRLVPFLHWPSDPSSPSLPCPLGRPPLVPFSLFSILSPSLCFKLTFLSSFTF